MKRTYFISIAFIAFLAIVILPSCRFRCIKGSGNHVSENHKVSDFTRINVSGGFKVTLKQDSSLNVSINADDNLMKYIHVESDGDELKVYYKKNVCPSGQMEISIGVRNLEKLKGSGAINFVSDGKINTKDLDIKLNGASNINMDLSAANLSTESAGASEITLRGQATSHRIEMTGNGTVHAFDFVVGKYDLHTTGASDCEINVLNDLQVSSTGAADVKYKGNPANVNTSKLGAATVTHVN
ncbi:head GIN domain-containing protein [Mucilaginibacter sp.]|uniref:head GIN domain-containing protein n=1 Tax=Mucilaginibacter sp. TaxID=1882438 RepID=UPI002C36C554|nr:head GIN domain-containing protein [Mucilaginibacter sp.]HTI58053.1 head GIN domain-containing protein [Mucilaginibacter sp.]